MKYPLNKLYEHRRKVKPQLTERVFEHYKKIQQHFTSYSIDLEDLNQSLANISLAELEDFVSTEKRLKDLLFEWTEIDYRVENSLEYDQILNNFEKIKSIQEKLRERKDEMLKDIKTLFSEYLKDLQRKVFDLRHNKIQVEEVVYSDFKGYVEDYLGDNVKIKVLLSLKNVDDLFELIKTDALINKLKKQKIIEDNNGYIDIAELEEKEALLYEHLRSEALREFCKNEFSHKVSTTKTSTQIEVNPSSELGEKMNLKTSELVFINISLDNFDMDFEDLKKRFDGKQFTLLDGRKYDLQNISRVKVHPFVVEKKMLSGDALKIKIPIFYRHAVFNLIKSQRMLKK